VLSGVDIPVLTDQDEQTCSFALLAALGESFQEPQTYAQAMRSPQADQWQDAMNREYNSLIENNTWTLVPLPRDRTVVQNKWVYKVKYKTDGAVDKFKARLVAKGFTQKAGIDYSETFSPVIKHQSIRVLLATAAEKHMQLRQFDIGTAFLNGDLSEEIYMKQPIGFISSTHTDFVCQLH
jgi:hypothetical protein